MAKFMVLYRAAVSPAEQMGNATPEQAQAGMEAWMAWAGKAGPALVDMGSPLSSVDCVGSAPAGDGFIGGYSILEAASAKEVRALLEDHPHLVVPGAGIEVLEFLPIPGM